MPPLVGIGLTELSNSGWAKTHPAHPLAASLILGLALHADMIQITDLHLFYRDWIFILSDYIDIFIKKTCRKLADKFDLIRPIKQSYLQCCKMMFPWPPFTFMR